MIKVAIVGFGNIGKSVYEAISASEDLALKCIVEPREVAVDVPVLKSVTELNDIDVAFCLQARSSRYCRNTIVKGISTVDSFDIHSNIVDVRSKLDIIAKKTTVLQLQQPDGIRVPTR